MTVDDKLARRRLSARKAELEELSANSADDRAAVTLDQQSVGRLSRMDAMQQQAMSQAQERARAAELHRIDQAYRRLEDGEYGYCQVCGEDIPDKRLAIDPSAATCVKCAG
jgi:DnaK suppressor protein